MGGEGIVGMYGLLVVGVLPVALAGVFAGVVAGVVAPFWPPVWTFSSTIWPTFWKNAEESPSTFLVSTSVLICRLPSVFFVTFTLYQPMYQPTPPIPRIKIPIKANKFLMF